MPNPYVNLGREAFWRSGVLASSPTDLEGIYKKKWDLLSQDKIACAGSCFAQHISHYLRAAGFNVLDLEPPPHWLARRKDTKEIVRASIDPYLARPFGYFTYSARYGNIYTVQSLLQLAKEAFGLFQPRFAVWEKEGRYFDALRPSVEPQGLDSIDEVVIHRKVHLAKVREVFRTMDVFVFTFGLTEAWVHSASNTVYPTAPGTVAGSFEPDTFAFRNYGFAEMLDAFLEFDELLRTHRENGRPPRILLTVSPVPLTATASGKHVLHATSHSKSLLRSVAGELESRSPHIDYFPAYEIVTNPASRGSFYQDNLRSVRADAVEVVMKHFFREHRGHGSGRLRSADSWADGEPGAIVPCDPECEDVLLESFGR